MSIALALLLVEIRIQELTDPRALRHAMLRCEADRRDPAGTKGRV